MRRVRRFLTLAALTAVAACSDSGSSDTTDFDGVIASDGLSGTINISVPGVVASVAAPNFAGSITAGPTEPAATVNVTATLKVKGGSNVSLTGTYDLDSKTLGLNGSGYTFTATFASGRLSARSACARRVLRISAETSGGVTIRSPMRMRTTSVLSGTTVYGR